MSKHTPGPWHVSKSARTLAGDVQISRFGDDGVYRIGDHPLITVHSGFSDWENKYPADANARLIAAAPEMLEALRFYADGGHIGGQWCDGSGAPHTTTDVAEDGRRARAAIAKAEGRS